MWDRNTNWIERSSSYTHSYQGRTTGRTTGRTCWNPHRQQLQLRIEPRTIIGPDICSLTSRFFTRPQIVTRVVRMLRGFGHSQCFHENLIKHLEAVLWPNCDITHVHYKWNITKCTFKVSFCTDFFYPGYISKPALIAMIKTSVCLSWPSLGLSRRSGGPCKKEKKNHCMLTSSCLGQESKGGQPTATQ